MPQTPKSDTVDIDKDSVYTSPITLFPGVDAELQDFYQYRVANSSDSPMSLCLDTMLSDTEKDELWNRMLKAIDVTENKFIFNSILRNKIADIQALKLSDTTLTCDEIKGFAHIKNPPKNSNERVQHKIDTLFKRFRDAFAHGRVGVNNKYFIFEDKQKQITGRIIITKEALRTWKIVIEKYFNERK